MTEATQLTGADVERIRKEYGLSRKELAIMCGFPETGVRINNIEKNDSWKDGDRDKVAAALAQLAANPPSAQRTGRKKGETGAARAERLMNRLHAAGKAIDDYAEPPVYNPLLEEDPPEAVEWVASDLDGAQDEGAFFTTPIDEVDVTDVVPDVVPVDVPGLKLLANSEVATWQRCRRKWWLAFYRKLIARRQDLTGARAIGGRVHRALAAWYVPEGDEPTDPREALERAIVEDWTALAEQIRATTPEAAVDEALATTSVQFQDAVTLERAMVEGYVQWIEESGVDSEIRVIAPETALHADVKVDVDGEKVPLRLIGKLDVRVRRAIDGVRLYVDHKTVGNLTSPRKILHMDPQMLHYHLLEFLNSTDADQRCDGALYNMLRKVKRTQAAHPPFYDRLEVHHNQREIESYHLRLLGAASDIIRAERRLAAGANPLVVAYPTVSDRCSWDCDFYGVCPMFDDGSRVEDAVSQLFQVGDPLERYDGQLDS